MNSPTSSASSPAPRRGLVVEFAGLPASVMAGTPLEAVVRVRNAGRTAEGLPESGHLNPVSFRVFNAAGELLHEVSERERRASALHGGVVPPEAPMTPLGAGEARVYEGDVAELLREPLPEGRYQLQARIYGAGAFIESERRPFAIVTPSVAACARVLDPDDDLFVTVLAAPIEGGGGQLLAAYAWPANPAERTLRTVEVLEGPLPEALSLAAPAAPAEGQFWAAWLRRGGLAGALVREYDTAAPFDVGPIGLARPELAPSGLQIEGRRAWFGVVGAPEDGRQPLALVEVSRGTSPMTRRIELRGTPASRPQLQWAAAESRAPRLRVVWFNRDHTGSDLRFAEVPLDEDASVPELRSLSLGSGRLEAVRLCAVDRGGDATLAWVEGGSTPDAPPTLSWMSLSQPELRSQSRLPAAQEGFAFERVGRWLIAETSEGEPLVLALAGSLLWRPMADRWAPVASLTGPVQQNDQVMVIAGRAWLSSWVPGRFPEMLAILDRELEQG